VGGHSPGRCWRRRVGESTTARRRSGGGPAVAAWSATVGPPELPPVPQGVEFVYLVVWGRDQAMLLRGGRLPARPPRRCVRRPRACMCALPL
jgi:hypothetical protein